MHRFSPSMMWVKVRYLTYKTACLEPRRGHVCLKTMY